VLKEKKSMNCPGPGNEGKGAGRSARRKGGRGGGPPRKGVVRRYAVKNSVLQKRSDLGGGVPDSHGERCPDVTTAAKAAAADWSNIRGVAGRGSPVPREKGKLPETASGDQVS